MTATSETPAALAGLPAVLAAETNRVARASSRRHPRPVIASL